MEKIKIGIIICDRYRTCAGGKCFRSAANREGAFAIYKDQEIEIAGFTSCGGCPGGNIEYVPEEMAKNGITHIHFATGLIVGYPPCPYMEYFEKFIIEKYGMKVIAGTHPVPQKYYHTHMKLNTWSDDYMMNAVENILGDEKTRLDYD
ncbi:MAG: CGGC domain-containing protein [Bacteroidales bacterium]|nr:CGGC domain-containing protein [Bacteroidales bacterium]MBN2633326.1 CGGC domain-containing protein [Bacteroidales bacterium]